MWEEATRGNIFLDQEASETGRAQRLATYKAWSSDNTLSGLSVDSVRPGSEPPQHCRTQ